MNIYKSAFLCALLSLGLVLSAAAQDVITTIAGGGPNGIPAVNADLSNPYETAIDTQGNIYVAVETQQRVYKISAAGVITIVAGNGSYGYNGDNILAKNATLYNPHGVAVDTANPANVYIGDYNNCLVRKVNQTTGIITTVAGFVNHPATGNPYTTCGYNGDNKAANTAELYNPQGLAVSPTNGDLYIADTANGRIRKVSGGSPTGNIITVAGGGGSTTAGNNCGGTSPYGDGAAASAAYLCSPNAVALDASVSPANVFISNYGGGVCAVREVVGSSGKIYLVAGNYALGCGFKDNVAANLGQLYDPWQMTVKVAAGVTTVAVADYYNARIRQFTLTYTSAVPTPGTLLTVAGKGSGGYCGDNGPALSACMSPVGLVADTAGDLLIGDYGSDRVRKVLKSTGYISTIAGWGANGGTNTLYSNPVGISNIPGGGVSLYYPFGIFADTRSTKVYIGGYNGQADYWVDSATGNISNLAGNGVGGFQGDGTAANGAGTELDNPVGIVKDSSGNVYLADQGYCVVRMINPSGIISTVVGGSNGHYNGCGYTGDNGTAVNAQIYTPWALAIDKSNNLYISDPGYCVIRRVAAGTNIITTYAGSGTCGYSGDGGSATAAKIYQVYGLAVDANYNLLLADTYNQRIRKVTPSKVITTIAGTGVAGYTGDGLAVGNSLYYPKGVATDANGSIFISDTDNNILRWIDTSGQMITFAGNPPPSTLGSYGFAGDGGVATKALMAYPAHLGQDASGNYYVADQYNHRVRKITPFAGLNRSVSSLVFTNTPTGTVSNFLPVKLSAIGSLPISSISVTAGFFEIDDCPATLAAEQSCYVDVYFSPTSAGNITGTLTVNSTPFFAANQKTVALSGTSAGMTASGSLAFGTVLLNTALAKTVTVTNGGAAAVTLGTVYLTQTTDFSITGGTCPLTGGTLASKASCTVIVTYKTATIGYKKSTLVVSSNDAASPLMVQATGTGTSVKLSATAINFGAVTHGTNVVSNLTITNVSTTAALTVTSAVTGTGFAVLTTGNTCTVAVAATKSCVLPVQFAPSAVQAYTGTLTLTTNGGSNPTVSLTGSGK